MAAPHSSFCNSQFAIRNLQCPSPTRRPGFTLVELLVVIAIIGLLAAIAIPAIFGAVTNAREAAIAQEISQLEMAVESYKNANNDYPPNFFEDYSSPTTWTNTVAFRHLKRVTRHASENMAAWTLGGNALLGAPADTQIDAAETLMFWLGGLSKNASSPVSGGNGPLILSGTTVAVRPTAERENSYFEFKEDRIIDVDGDGLPEYRPPYGEPAPYVYFDGRAYDNTPDSNNDGIPDAGSDDLYAQYPPASNTTLIAQFGVVRPYVVAATGAGNVTPVYANDGKFQIISAGLDGRYGEITGSEFTTAMTRKTYTTEFSQGKTQFTGAINYRPEDFDNITNFSGGPLEDAMP